jgi:4-amino-4-deoxy-L-arabinose transferase-like glycosyltransferase
MTTTFTPQLPPYTPPEDGVEPPPRARTMRRWVQPLSLASLLFATGLLYIVGLSASGWANQFYAAAAQAGSKSWKAMLFGSLDASNYITVDKPPASLWVMDLSMRLFGTNSWSLLVPQALEGVAAVALLYFAVKRVAGHWGGMLAGAALATTPVATLMFRFDNPDAMLVLLMTAGVYATVRSLEKARLRWLMLAGALLGFAFLTKMLQGLVIVPVLAAVYLFAAPTTLRRRLLHVFAAGGAMLAAAGWWVALVELWPAASRPYIGGSTNNSILQLTFGYNGFGRLTGSNNNGTPGGGGGGGFSAGQTGLGRLFGAEMGTQVSWLLPAALIAFVALIWGTWRKPRTDRLRASALLWGGWLLLNGVVFSYASGIIHPYYSVAVAPPIAALVAIGTATLLKHRANPRALGLLVAMVAASTYWTWVLLGRASWHPELRWIVLIAGVLGIVGLVAKARTLLVAPVLAIGLLIAPTAYSLQTAATAHSGALPTAGPSGGGFGRPGGGFGGGRGGAGGFGGGAFIGTPPGVTTNGGATNGSTTGGSGGTSAGGPPSGGGFGGGFGGGGFGGGPGGGLGGGGLGGASTTSAQLVVALQSGNYEWSAAVTSANEAASLELSSNTSVMAIGGFNGTDNATTLAAFQALVAAHKIHYYISDGGSGFIGSTSSSGTVAQQIQQWVTSHYTSTTIGGTTVYDLTSAPSATSATG